MECVENLFIKLLRQNQFTLTGMTQAIFITLVNDDYFPETL